jgi:hypothetical protein
MLRQLKMSLLALLWLQCDAELHQEVIERVHQVINEVELVVVHIPGQNYRDGPTTLQSHLL